MKYIITISILVVLLIAGLFIHARITTLHTLTLNDPLFYSPELNTEMLRNAIAQLKESERNMLSVLASHADNKTTENTEKEFQMFYSLREQGFLPTEYLTELADVIDATNRFLEHSTLITALQLRSMQIKIADTYYESAKHLYGAAEMARAIDRNTSYSMRLFASETHTTQLLSDLELLIKNGTDLKEEVSARSRCLFGGECPKEKAYTSKYIPASREKPPLLPDEVVNLGYDGFERSGPYAIHSGCFPNTVTQMYLFQEDDYMLPKDATENYYTDFAFQSERYPDNLYVKAFTDNNILYHARPDGTDYRCADLSYWGDITTLNWLEKNTDFNTLTGSIDLTSVYSSSQDRKIKGIIENKIVALPHMLTAMSMHLNVYTTLIKSYQQRISLFYLLTIRSNYSLTFGTFSHSIWRLDEKPQYYSRRNIDAEERFKTYTELEQLYPLETIETFHFDTDLYVE